MPAASSDHPDPQTLARYNLGKLDDEQTSEVESHIVECDDCARTLSGMGGDTFIELLRRQGSAAPPELSAPTLPPVNELATLAYRGATRAEAFPADTIRDLPAELRQHSRYDIQRRLGRGGMGDVYLAQHRIMNRLVALKVIHPQLLSHRRAVERFRREVHAAARLSHPNIVTAHDADQAAGLHFLVMEYVEGTDLDQVIKQRGPLPVAEACDYLRQAAEGLHYAHQLGMVHRDIKPHNLMLSEKGTVKILDFGLANFANEVAEELTIAGELPEPAQETSGESPAATLVALTQMGAMMGTPDYIAPEQARDAHSADIRADIYSLGCTFYALLTGRAPFGEGTVLDKIKAHHELEAPPLAAFRQDVPAEAEAILQKMMAKDPANRYQTPQEVLDALAAFIDARIEDKLRDMGVDRSPPPKPPRDVDFEEYDARDWYERLAGFMWNVAIVDLIGAALLALLIALLAYSGAEGLEAFVMRPLTVVALAGALPGAVLLGVVPKVRRMEGLGWVVLASFLCLLPAMGWPLGLIVGSLALGYLLWPTFRPPFRAILSPTRTSMLVAACMIPIGFVATGVSLYLQTNTGTLVIETDDPRVRVAVDRQGKRVRIVGNQGAEGAQRVKLRVGEYHLSIIDSSSEMTLTPNKVIIRRGGEQWVRVQLVPKQAERSSDSRRPSGFFQSLGDLQAIVGKTLIDAGVKVGQLEPSSGAEAGLRRNIVLSAQITGEDDRGEKALTALKNKFETLSQSGDAVITDLKKYGKKGVDGYHLAYATANHQGLIRLSLEDSGADQRMPSIRHWSLAVHVDEWSKSLAPPREPNAPGASALLVEEVRLEGHRKYVLDLAFTPNGTHLITGGAEGAIVWNARNGRRVRELPEQTGSVHAVAVSADGNRVAIAGKGDAILVADLATGKEIGRFTGHTGFVECIAFSPSGRRLASGSSNWVRKQRGDLTVRMWDLETGREVWQADAPRTPTGFGMVYEVLFTPDGRQVVTVHHGPRDGISVWDAATGDLLRRFSGSHSSIKCAALSPDGKTLATGHEAVAMHQRVWDDPEHAVIRLWDLASGREIGRLVGHTGGIRSLDFSADGGRLLSCSGGQFLNDDFNPHPSRDNTLRIWDIATRREMLRQPLEKHGQRAVFSADGRSIASAAGEVGEIPLVQIWRLPENLEQTTGNPEPD